MKWSAWQGSWALVTGASAGIGRALAMRIAGKGLNVVLVARREAELRATAAEIERVHNVGTRVVPLDLAAPGAAAALVTRIREAGIRVRLLVNNAGIGQWGRFELSSPERYEQMIRLNVQAVCDLSLLFLEDLASHGSSAIVQVSSPAAMQPVPFMAVYAASKAFVHSFGLALNEEWRDRGITVQTLVPGPTATEFDRLAGAYRSALGERRGAADDVARACLAALEAEAPVALTARRVFGQKLFAAVAPTRYLLAAIGKMFRPPSEG